MVADQPAPEINPSALSELLRDALPIGRPGELELRHPFRVIITALLVTGDDYAAYLPDVESALDKTDTGQVTEIGVSVTLAGSAIQPDREAGPFINPLRLYDGKTGSLGLSTVTANFLLAAGIRRQAGRIRTGFSQPHDTREMYGFAKQRTDRMIAGQVEPVIRLNT